MRPVLVASWIGTPARVLKVKSYPPFANALQLICGAPAGAPHRLFYEQKLLNARGMLAPWPLYGAGHIHTVRPAKWNSRSTILDSFEDEAIRQALATGPGPNSKAVASQPLFAQNSDAICLQRLIKQSDTHTRSSIGVWAGQRGQSRCPGHLAAQHQQNTHTLRGPKACGMRPYLLLLHLPRCFADAS